MSIQRPNPGRKQGSSTARMSKTASNSPSNLEKRDKDQHESQDTNPPIPTIHEESSPEKKFYKHFQNSPVKIIMAPTPHYFSAATRTNTFTFTRTSHLHSPPRIISQQHIHP